MGSCGLDVELDLAFPKRPCLRRSSLYTAPEVYESGACLKSDVWSLGMSVIEMAEGRHPFAGYSEEEVRDAVRHERLSISCEWSFVWIDFVKRCLVKDVNKRASVKELLRVGVSLAS